MVIVNCFRFYFSRADRCRFALTAALFSDCSSRALLDLQHPNRPNGRALRMPNTSRRTYSVRHSHQFQWDCPERTSASGGLRTAAPPNLIKWPVLSWDQSGVRPEQFTEQARVKRLIASRAQEKNSADQNAKWNCRLISCECYWMLSNVF